jgi:iron uptake system component EfeO
VPILARRLVVMAGVGVAAALAVAGCSSSSHGPADSSGINVKASDTACVPASTTFLSGTQTFAVSNVGSQVTEFLVYAPGDRVVGEVGNIGPSTGKRLTVALKAGEYDLTCKPGRSGKGIRTPIVVKARSGVQPTTSPELDAAVATYRSYVVGQARLLQTRSKPFVAAVQAGDVLKAMALYPGARAPYDAMAPVAASFGDLDARIDARIDDVEVGQQWTGFHRLEHDLWSTADVVDISKDGTVAQQLQADIDRLVDQVQRIDLSADQIATGAVSTLKQVATVKLTGDEERYSHLDLTDANANVQGAQQVYEALRPIVLTQDPELVLKVDTRFATLEEDLAQYNLGATFAVYEALSKSQLHQLTSDVNALLSPMGQVADAIQKA